MRALHWYCYENTLRFDVLILIVGGILTSLRMDPLRNCRFRVEIDGITVQTNPCHISGLWAAIEYTEYHEGADTLQVRQLGGLPKYGTLILKFGLTNSTDLYNWFKNGISGIADQRNMGIVAQDLQGNDITRWTLTNAWPAKYQAPDFNGKGNYVALETFEIVYESLVRDS